MSRFLSRSSRLIETFETNQDKTRFFEIFVGNRDFVEINRDIFSLDRDILDFRHLWKVVGEGFTLTFISLPWASPTTFHRFLQLKKISRSRYIKNQVISRSRSRKISRYPEKSQKSISLEKSRSRLKSKVLANLIETKSRNLDLDRDFSILETNFCKPSRFSRPSRLIFFGRRDRDLDRDHVETNQDPQAYK